MQLFRILLIVSFFSLLGQFEPTITGISGIPEVNKIPSSARTLASATDTLTLPFFDDFTCYDKRIDSIVIKNGQSVRLYSGYLDSLGAGGTVIISFPDSILPGILSTYPIHGTAHLQQESSGIYTMDTTYSGYVSALSFASDTVMYTAYWAKKGESYLTLDPYRWETSDVYINNRFAMEQPSFNVATFDGIKSNGSPYSNSSTAVGQTDVLTSRKINLSYKDTNPNKIIPADSVYLSFYFQTKGFGETPDKKDYLSVQFLDSNRTWVDIWKELGSKTILKDTFQIVNIAIKDLLYFHEGFQFRFLSYGRQCGMYDVWNVDYVYLNKNRGYQYKPLQDWTLGEMGNTFLKNYSAMPYRHFLSDVSNQRDSIPYSVLNLSQFPFANVDVYGDFYDNLGNFMNFNTLDTFFSNIPQYLSNQFFNVNANGLGMPIDPRIAYQHLRVSTKDSALAFIHANNEWTTTTDLFNYYAYDDGTAEAGFGFSAIGAKMNNEYVFIMDDTITHVDFKFVRTQGPDMTGRSIILKIWDETFKELRSQVISVSYNNIARYTLNNSLPVDSGKKYYVGYMQNFIDLLTVGFDRNTNRSDKIYYHSGSSFVPYNTIVGADSGALMIRPVFVKSGEVLVSVDDPVFVPDFSIHPNPTMDRITVVGKIEDYQLLSLMGEVMLSGKGIPSEDLEIDLSAMPAGVYLLRSGGVVKRIVKF